LTKDVYLKTFAVFGLEEYRFLLLCCSLVANFVSYFHDTFHASE
jgi:hypothetical protein